MINQNTIKTLEYDKILNLISKFAVSVSAKTAIKEILPEQTYEEVLIRLDETQEADMLLYQHIISPEFNFDDCKEFVINAEKGQVLSMGELLKIARLIKLSRLAGQSILAINDDKIVLLRNLANTLYSDIYTEELIFKSIISDTEMADCASSKLKEIRKAVADANDRVRKTLNGFVQSTKYNKYLQDNIVTIRAGRYVLPVKCEYKSQIQGLVHDQSSTGATLFVEPYAVVELNNKISSLKIDEMNEINRILSEFSMHIGSKKSLLINNQSTLTMLDTIFAKAFYCHSIKAVYPILNNKGKIKIIAGRHPLIDKNKVVPVNIAFGADFLALLISGPNTGGKTVTLKLTGLFTLMAMSGIFIPVSYESEISYFENVFCDIGDAQSIENDLSTFSSHIANIINITENVNNSALILLDELGGGTDPEEGACLAIAILEFLLEKNCRVILTSHYNQLKEYSYTNKKIKNASMDFDPLTYAPTYRLLIGMSGASNAIQISKRLGLDKNIIDNAIKNLSVEKITFDKVILSAEKSRRDLENNLNEITKNKNEIEIELVEIKKEREYLANERRRLNEFAKKEAKHLIKDYLEEAEEYLEEIKEKVKTATEEDLFEARRLIKKIEKIEIKEESNADIMEYDKTPIQLGDKVLVKSVNCQGIVDEINQKKGVYKIRMGIINSFFKFEDVAKLMSEHSSENKKINFSKQFSNTTCPNEIKLLGQRREEALSNLDAYIDKFLISGLTEARIVHGKGTGILKQSVHEFLRDYKNISYRLGKYGEGEDGVTIITIKK